LAILLSSVPNSLSPNAATLHDDFDCDTDTDTDTWIGNGLVALLPRAHQAAGPTASTKNGGATASLPFYPARTKPPATAALHDDTDTDTSRGNGLVALLPRVHQAAGHGGPP